MAKINIGYDVDRRLATVSIGQGSSWAYLRRLFIENSENVELTGPSSLALPWWEFVSLTEPLRYHARRLDLEIEFEDIAAERIEESEERLKSFEESAEAKPVDTADFVGKLVENGFSRRLTEQQLRNACRLAAMPAGATFSVPGAGKTSEALAFFFYLQQEKSRLLVICPKNAFAAWEEQLAECAPAVAESFVRLTGGERSIRNLLKASPRLMLMTYQQLSIGKISGIIGRYLDDYDAFIFLDESHKIKGGRDRKWAGTVLSMSDLPRAKLLLTGTPMPNNVSDLIPQFEFLYPEMSPQADDVAKLFKNVYVRTTKDELGLRDPIQKLVSVPLRPAQERLYRLIASEFARQSENIDPRDQLRLRKLGRSALRLIQIASNPSLVSNQYLDHSEVLSEVLAEGDSPKIEVACNLAREYAEAGRKCIIWSGFRGTVENLSELLEDLGADYIHGGVDAGSDQEEDTREAKVKRFHDDDECYVLVANPAACGEGISLHTVCHHAIYVDRNYNAAHFLQSQDRIHRLGLPVNQDTYISVLHAPATVDESVDRRLKAKIDAMAVTLNDASLNWEPVPVDLEDEIGLLSEDIDDFIQHLKTIGEGG